MTDILKKLRRLTQSYSNRDVIGSADAREQIDDWNNNGQRVPTIRNKDDDLKLGYIRVLKQKKLENRVFEDVVENSSNFLEQQVTTQRFNQNIDELELKKSITTLGQKNQLQNDLIPTIIQPDSNQQVRKINNLFSNKQIQRQPLRQPDANNNRFFKYQNTLSPHSKSKSQNKQMSNQKIKLSPRSPIQIIHSQKIYTEEIQHSRQQSDKLNAFSPGRSIESPNQRKSLPSPKETSRNSLAFSRREFIFSMKGFKTNPTSPKHTPKKSKLLSPQAKLLKDELEQMKLSQRLSKKIRWPITILN